MLLFLLFIVPTISAQKNVADSFLRVFRDHKTDSQQTQTVLTWLESKKGGFFDSSSYYPIQIMQTGQQYGNKDVQALGHAIIGYSHGRQNNPSMALEHYLKALALGEQRNDKRIMLRLYHFVSFYGEPRKSIEYQQRVIALPKQTGEMNWEALANQQIVTHI